MMHTIKYILAAFIVLKAQDVGAQNVPDMTLNSHFEAQVKSIDEFISRFNGAETHPEVVCDSNQRRNNIIALFDYRMSHDSLSADVFRRLVAGFVTKVMESGVTLKLTDADMWAEAQSSMTIGGKKKVVSLILKSETYKGNYVRWAIAGVRGLVDAGVIDTSKYYAISPVEHELHFMSLDGIINGNRTDIMGYRSKKAHVDELSVFLSLVMTGKINFGMVEELTIHCLEVPGYVFTINEQGRKGTNSGWLISKLTKIDDGEKKKYITKLLNNRNL